MVSVIACSLDAAGLKGRQHLLVGLVSRASECRELKDGYSFGFAPGTAGLVELAEIIEPERRCCSFLRFIVTAEAEGGPLWLEVTGPDTAKEFLRGLLDLA